MSPDLIAAAFLTAPAAVLGPICIAGHRRQARHDAIAAAVLATYHPGRPNQPPTGPPPARERLTPQQAAPAQLAAVIDLDTRRRQAA